MHLVNAAGSIAAANREDSLCPRNRLAASVSFAGGTDKSLKIVESIKFEVSASMGLVSGLHGPV